MQAQLPPSQQNFPYNGQPPSSQAQYQSNGVHYDARSQQQDYTNGYAHEPNMNPYQQYAGGYGQQPQQPPQMPQLPHSQRPYMPSQNQLPPLIPGQPQGMPGMPPVREDSNSYANTSANHVQPSAYTTAPSQSMPTPQQSLPPPSRPGQTQPQEKKMSSSSSRDGYRYSLEVVQQPQRARMCGFGDKDRRPITPPPCVRLVIVDDATGREIDVNEITSDPSFFVLQVDLWAENADREANVVRASSNSPAVSISSATTTSYPPPAEHRPMHEQPVMYYNQETGQTMYGWPSMPLSRPGMMGPQYPGLYYPHPSGQMIHMPPAQTSSSAMYTRNLIGSLTVNAARLSDPQGKTGYWFVLQDLSVRTEGHFRLRMSFIDISNHGAPGVNRGKAPVLAWTFSDRFQVYSAKKFPGVIESTPLSKCFAGQGIKIPIRKDNKNDAADDDED